MSILYATAVGADEALIGRGQLCGRVGMVICDLGRHWPIATRSVAGCRRGFCILEMDAIVF